MNAARDARSKRLKVMEEELSRAALPPELGRYRPSWPRDPADLSPLPSPSQTVSPFWSHSAGAESWFLEDKTPSLHQNYSDFYERNMRALVAGASLRV